jgi:hypothetical protein
MNSLSCPAARFLHFPAAFATSYAITQLPTMPHHARHPARSQSRTQSRPPSLHRSPRTASTASAAKKTFSPQREQRPLASITLRILSGSRYSVSTSSYSCCLIPRLTQTHTRCTPGTSQRSLIQAASRSSRACLSLHLLRNPASTTPHLCTTPLYCT